MKAAHVSYQPGPTRQTRFPASFGVSLLIHGLVIGWMLSGSGRSHSLLPDVPSFQMVSLVDAPGPALLPEAQPRAIAEEPAAVPEIMSAVTVPNVVPEAVVPPPQAKQATAVPEASVEPPAPAAKPEPVAAPEKPSVVETEVKKPKPAKATAKKTVPTQTAARKSTPAAPKVDAAQPRSAPKAAANPRPPASRNSPQAAARARETIANMRRAQAHAQGTSAIEARGGVVSRLQNIQLQAYQGRVRARIISAWRLPMMRRTAEALQAVALLTVDREGQLLRYQLIESSGNQTFDDSLERAVWASSPLPPLPETFPEETREIEIHFTPPASS